MNDYNWKNVLKKKGTIDLRTIEHAEEQIRLAGDGTAHDPRCRHTKNCAYENDTCDPDTCHFTSQFYKGVHD